MFEAKITITAPELSSAINNLAAAIANSAAQGQATTFAGTVNAGAPVNPTTPPAGMPAPTPNQAAPYTANAPAPAAAPNPTLPAGQPQAAAAPNPALSAAYPSNVPLSPAPTYTIDQIMTAGATLMDAGKALELTNLLHSFGVQAVMDLKPEQLGLFATAMRELGAKI